MTCVGSTTTGCVGSVITGCVGSVTTPGPPVSGWPTIRTCTRAGAGLLRLPSLSSTTSVKTCRPTEMPPSTTTTGSAVTTGWPTTNFVTAQETIVQMNLTTLPGGGSLDALPSS